MSQPIRIIATIDSHLTMRNPKSRKDIYYDEILDQWRDLVQAAVDHDAVAVLHAGDVFDAPKISNRLAGWLALIIRDLPCPVYVVPGNHDIFGHNAETLDQTTLGLLAKSGIFRILDKDNPATININNVSVKLHGREYHADIDKRDWRLDYDIDSDPYVDYNFLVVHGMLVDEKLPDYIHHTHIDTVKQTQADLVLAGHNHKGFKNGIVEKNKKLFINPGSMARKDASIESMRMPNYIVIEIDKHNGIKAWLEPFKSAKPWEEVLDRELLLAQKARAESLDAFKETISESTQFESLNIFDILVSIATNLQSTAEVRQLAFHALQEAHRGDEENKKVYEDYEPSALPVTINWIELANFQSHKNTRIEFSSSGLNAILGMSDQGKTAVIRALRWVLYNEPQGSDFIKIGEKNCEVSIGLSSGHIITRRRTEKSSGEYEISDANGSINKFSSFGNTPPVDIFNLHQMPPVAIQKDFETSLNIAYQLDGPFLLSESPIVRAAAVGKLVGVQVADTAIKEISKDILNAQRDIKSKIGQKEIAEKSLSQFADLPALEDKIIRVEFLLSQYEILSEQLNQCVTLRERLSKVNTNRMSVGKQLDLLMHIDDAIVLLNQIEELYETYRSVSVLATMHKNVFRGLFDCNNLLNSLPDVDALQSGIDESDTLQRHIDSIKVMSKRLADYNNNIVKVSDTLKGMPDIDNINRLLTETEQLSSVTDNMRAFISRLKTAEQQILGLEKRSNNADIVFANETKNYADLLRDTGHCPLCLSEITSDTIDHIISEALGGKS